MTRGATWPASDLLALVAKFRDERDWARFHSSKDLALSVSIEAAELLECFQWSGDDLEAPERSAEIEAEMADVLIYLAMLADHRGVDLDRAVRAKLAANEKKYPATAVKGEASAARAAARAIHEEARRTGDARGRTPLRRRKTSWRRGRRRLPRRKSPNFARNPVRRR